MDRAILSALRPLTMGQILDRAIWLYRRRFLTFIGIIAVAQVPILAIQLLISLLTFTPWFERLQDPAYVPANPLDIFDANYIAGISGSLFLTLISFVLVQGVAASALTYAATSSYLGHPVGLVDAYRAVARFWRSIVGALLLFVIFGFALLFWTVIPCIGQVSLLFTMGLGMYVFVALLPLVVPVIVIEQQTAGQAIRRAWNLARQRYWWVLGFMIILALFAQLIITGPSALIAVLMQTPSGFFAGAGGDLATQQILQSLLTLISSLLYLPLQITAAVLLYLDLRVRQEGFDLMLAAAAAGDAPITLQTVFEQAPTAADEPMFVGSDWLNLVGTSFLLILFGLLLLLVVFTIAAGAMLGGF